MGKIRYTQIVGHDDCDIFHNRLAEAIREMQNKDNLNVEVQYSTNIVNDYRMVYSALLLGREKEGVIYAED